MRVATWSDGVPGQCAGEGHDEEMEHGRGAAAEMPWSWRRARSKFKVLAWGRRGDGGTGRWEGWAHGDAVARVTKVERRGNTGLGMLTRTAVGEGSGRAVEPQVQRGTVWT